MMQLFTIGELANRIGAPQHRVGYAIRSRGIEPVARAGGYRLFDEAAAERVRTELRRIDQHNSWRAA